MNRERRAAYTLLFHMLKEAGLTADEPGTRAWRQCFELGTGPCGKPELLHNKKGWHFNLSHSGRFAACVVSDRPVGIDVEDASLRRTMDFRRIASRFFTGREACWVEEEDSLHRFLQLWTRKESFLKCSGEGLRRDLKSFDVLPGRSEADGSFLETNLGGAFLCVCLSADGRRPAILT